MGRAKSFQQLLFGFGLFILSAAPDLGLADIYVHQSFITFNWEDATGPVDHYNVYLSTSRGQSYTLTVEVTDPSVQLATEDGVSYMVQVEAEDSEGNVGPLSDASENVVVYLNGSADDTDGDGMTNTWETLYNFNPIDPSDGSEDADSDGLSNSEEFTAGTLPLNSDSDGDGISDGSEVLAGQDPLDEGDNLPVADAGVDQTLDPTVVTLDGSGSLDPNGDSLTYTWTQESGTEVTLSDTNVVNPTFLGKVRGEYRFQLVVNDGHADSQPDEVVVTIRNVKPTADAGTDAVVNAGDNVSLDGSGSQDPNEDSLTYTWTQLSGSPAVSLQGADSAQASFTPSESGVYLFQLVVNDGLLDSDEDVVQVTVNAENNVPVANAGTDRNETVNQTLYLDGSNSSDADGDQLQYLWSSEEAPEAIVLEESTSVQASFLPTQTGTYLFKLLVYDGTDWSAPDYVTITVENENRQPVAIIQPLDGEVVEGDLVILDGSASYDPDEDTLTYEWTQTGGPAVTLQNAYNDNAAFFAINAGTLTFQLVVDDGALSSVAAVVKIEVQSVYEPHDEPNVIPATYTMLQTDSGGSSSGCSSVLPDSTQHQANCSDLIFVLTLFLPAIVTIIYQKRKIRKGKAG